MEDCCCYQSPQKKRPRRRSCYQNMRDEVKASLGVYPMASLTAKIIPGWEEDDRQVGKEEEE